MLQRPRWPASCPFATRNVLLQNPFHTPDEMRHISDLAHVVEGFVLGTAAVVALLQARGVFIAGSRRFAWPGLIAGAGVFLLAYLFVPHHGLSLARTQWDFVLSDPQQRQHVAIAVLTLIGGTCELLMIAGRVHGNAWRVAWPASLVIIGILFLIHPQHGTSEAVSRATLLHRVTGCLFVAAGLTAAAKAFLRLKSAVLAALWPVWLLSAAIVLASYREPDGAFHPSDDHSAVHPDPTKKP
jgi:hypothetical protein